MEVEPLEIAMEESTDQFCTDMQNVTCTPNIDYYIQNSLYDPDEFNPNSFNNFRPMINVQYDIENYNSELVPYSNANQHLQHGNSSFLNQNSSGINSIGLDINVHVATQKLANIQLEYDDRLTKMKSIMHQPKNNQEICRMKKVQFLLPRKIEEKRNVSSLIRMYCSKCKRGFHNYTEKTCQLCKSDILYQCTNCTCVYKTFIMIQNHLKYDCAEDKIFYCTVCSYSSTYKTQLRLHLKNEHPYLYNKQPVHLCSLCNKKFKSQYNALAHERVCGFEQVHSCDFCTFKAKSRAGLKIHCTTKHQKQDDSYHKCPKCYLRFRTIGNLNRHIKRSCCNKSKYQCDHCDFKTNKRYPLMEHMQRNHSELFNHKSIDK
ncbi:zinc finger protein 711-like isoform X1 [Trichogramma pretiosum]|uniref:zinc finger protein 711-like isoform X1 n=2 Tax=Trichogramma pretiosum TaxID=7493 RepID=UPI0006C9BD92|nr:zinc finger protein 711-like isoform X1 [Trichogramma pretiosum]